MAELTLAAIRAQLVAGDLSVRDLAAEYLHRIATLDQAGPRLNAVIEVNPDVWDEADRLDALIEPSGGPAWLTDHINGDHYTGGKSAPTAVAGYPSVTVPLGYIGAGAAAPAGLPVGVSFVGAAWSEPRLIRCAYAFEQATRVRRPPAFLPTLAPYA